MVPTTYIFWVVPRILSANTAQKTQLFKSPRNRREKSVVTRPWQAATPAFMDPGDIISAAFVAESTAIIPRGFLGRWEINPDISLIPIILASTSEEISFIQDTFRLQIGSRLTGWDNVMKATQGVHTVYGAYAPGPLHTYFSFCAKDRGLTDLTAASPGRGGGIFTGK